MRMRERLVTAGLIAAGVVWLGLNLVLLWWQFH